MRYLLDTNVVVWYFDGKKLLRPKIKKIIDDPDNKVYVSIVSVWEIVVKLCVNKLNVSFTIDHLIESIKSRDFTLLPVKQKHLNANLKLPLIHGDPFDRLLIATSISEKLTFITSDKENQKYNVEWEWKNK